MLNVQGTNRLPNAIAAIYTQDTQALFHNFAVGDRVIFTDDYGFYDAGETGVIAEVLGNDLKVRFDSSGEIGEDKVPHVVLAATPPRDFRILTQHGIGGVSYPSEQAAIQAHAADATGNALEEFEVVEIVRSGSTYYVEASGPESE